MRPAKLAGEMEEMSPEAAHVVQLLRQAIGAAGTTLRDVERELGWSQGYLSRIFAGGLDLHFDHIIDIGKSLGVQPREIWHLLYPNAQNPPSETAIRLAEIARRFRPAASWTPEAQSGFEARLERAAWRVLSRRLRDGSR